MATRRRCLFQSQAQKRAKALSERVGDATSLRDSSLSPLARIKIALLAYLAQTTADLELGIRAYNIECIQWLEPSARVSQEFDSTSMIGGKMYWAIGAELCRRVKELPDGKKIEEGSDRTGGNRDLFTARARCLSGDHLHHPSLGRL